ncbi:hypothetical protein KMZ68_22865 [Bradyrhizobium sediminis]|uniref:Formate dehydrogenase n=1 Tax=Bradyrhizobium sediminis TaxID=2840469 RepID=A0A975NPL0_9BRAD|nr:hypothetical protein [Bradyrhizobium sediminis]QWG17764.1 hypothetical protein KMZ68_22865 [Bradyrhizobium sediminis]
MSKPSDSKAPAGQGKAQAVDRRRFFLMGGSAVAAAAVVPLSSEQAAADESQAERVKARYKETDHVKNYYRVNRY